MNVSRFCEQCIKTFTKNKFIIDDPDFFDTDKIYKDYITNYNRKVDFCLMKCYFKLAFNSFNPNIETNFFIMHQICHVKSFFYWIERCYLKG